MRPLRAQLVGEKRKADDGRDYKVTNYEEAEFGPRIAECGAAAFISKSAFGPDRLEAAWTAATV